MDKLGQRLEAIRTEVQVHWPEERARRGERALLRRRRRQTVLRTVSGVAAVLALLVFSRALYRSTTPYQGSATTAAQSSDRNPNDLLRLNDGSIVRLLDSTSRISELPASAAQGPMQVMSIDLQRGGARFEVVRVPSRLFRVRAGLVVVEVLGTGFTMERLGERTWVTVEHGRVRVLWPDGGAELGAGQSGLFPPEPGRSAASSALDQAATAATAVDPLPTAPARPDGALNGVPSAKPELAYTRTPATDWFALAQAGRFDSAYKALLQNGMGTVRGPANLLLAADVARLSRHPAAAVAPLRRILREHARDPRAPLAAFTLGRGLLDELGQPREAAEAFQACQGLAPEGPLAADALAREAEAWSRAGEVLRARERAQLYLKRYPDGDRRRSVLRYGDLD